MPLKLFLVVKRALKGRNTSELTNQNCLTANSVFFFFFFSLFLHLSIQIQFAQLVVLGLAVHSVAGSILLWGHFPVEGIFPLELTWVQTPFPPKTPSDESINRGLVCAHMHFIARTQKILTFMS